MNDMTAYEFEQLTHAAAWELGWALGAVKRASETNNPQVREIILNGLAPAHHELLAGFRAAGGQVAQV